MTCQKCKSTRVARLSAKCSDLCFVSVDGREHDGYVPSDMGIGGGDYVDLKWCLGCGQLQGEFPMSVSALEEDPLVRDEDDE